MASADQLGRPGTSTRLGDYSLVAAVSALNLLTIILPRTDKALPLREELRHWHYALGLLILALVLWRSFAWIGGRRPQPSPSLPPAARSWITVLTGLLFAMLALNPLIGIVSVWSQSLPLQIGPLPALPQLLPASRGVWLFSGYFHGAAGFALTLIALLTVLTGAYTLLRYRQGMLAAFPTGIGALGFVAFTIAVWALSTFKSDRNGPIAVGIFWALCLLAWGLSRWTGRDAQAARTALPVATRHWIVAGVGAAAVVAFATASPYLMFRVSPFESGTTVAGPAGVTWHESPALTQALPAETAFEREVKSENFKWCTFCHTTTKGAAPLVGPNLYGIYGQRIASVPGFHYSAALAARGERNDIWDDAHLDAFLADPDHFAPGTTMIISSGNVVDPAKRAMVITILKRVTGSAR